MPQMPIRQLGRLGDRDWRWLKRAAERQGITFTEWVLTTLFEKAREQNVPYPPAEEGDRE